MPKPVEKVNILFHKKDEEEISGFLQKKEIIQIVEQKTLSTEDKPNLENEKIKVSARRAEAKYVLDFLSSFGRRGKKTFKNKVKTILPPPKISLKENELERRVEEAGFNFKNVVEECKEAEAALNKLNNSIEELKAKKEIYKEWKNFPFKIRAVSELTNLKAMAGVVKQWDAFEDEINKLRLCELGFLPQESIRPRADKKRKLGRKFFLFYHPKVEKEIQGTLNKFKAEQNEEVKNLEDLPISELIKANRKLKRFFKEKRDIEKKINEMLFTHENEFKIMHDYLKWEEKKREVALQTDRTSRIVVLEGWVEKERMEELRRGLKEITDDFEICKLEPEKDEEAPVVVRHKAFLRPFELIANMYGVSRADEIDPVLPMIPFFILFFALCLGDAGYGLLLFFLSVFGIKLLKLPRENRNIFYLLMYLGAATSVVGVLFGGWFGIDLATLSDGWLKEILLKMRIADPMKDPIQILFVALALGIFQVLVGLSLKVYWDAITKGVKEALLNEFPWICLIVSLLLFGAEKTDIFLIKEGLAQYFALFSLLFVAFTQGRHQKNFAMKFLTGLGKLYGVTGYFSDVVSYSRLLALGLATGVIGSVVNLTAALVRDLVPVVGTAIFVVVLVVGHIGNLIISSFGAFIHSMRLQFVEFFPKFITSGGKLFTPLKREGSYIRLEEERSI